MPGASFTFRCGECNRLLGVSRSRVGATVTCPKCGRDLIVPDPGDEPEGGSPPESASGESALAGVPGFGAPPANSAGASAGQGEGGFPIVTVETDPFTLRPPEPSRPYRVPDRSRPSPTSTSPGPSPTSTSSSPSTEVIPPLVETEPEPISLRGLASTGSIETRGLARRNDVVMPRTAFLIWSFVMLVALTLAFAAGVLAGRFLWPELAAAPAPAPKAAAPRS